MQSQEPYEVTETEHEVRRLHSLRTGLGGNGLVVEVWTGDPNFTPWGQIRVRIRISSDKPVDGRVKAVVHITVKRDGSDTRFECNKAIVFDKESPPCAAQLFDEREHPGERVSLERDGWEAIIDDVVDIPIRRQLKPDGLPVGHYSIDFELTIDDGGEVHVTSMPLWITTYPNLPR
jgi:hypothetical protein